MVYVGKANSFIDSRIGEATPKNDYDRPDVMFRQLVQERILCSKNLMKYSPGDGGNDGDGGPTTHHSKRIEENYTGMPVDHDNALLSDDNEEDLDRVSTMLFFGNGNSDSNNSRERGAYGGGGGNGEEGGRTNSMGKVYRSRREKLKDRIWKKKMAMADKMKRKEDQLKTFKTKDELFAELLPPLNFCDKEQEGVKKCKAKMKGDLNQEEKEMDKWDKNAR